MLIKIRMILCFKKSLYKDLKVVYIGVEGA